jgi:Arc/MetJ-type ribon-helix-helix transcriptional regulator
MGKSITVKRKKRGRPATGKDPLIAARMPPELTAGIDAWAEGQDDRPGRSEAIRRLIELGLAGAKTMPRQSSKAAARASNMAAEQIDKLGDLSATDEERQERKRRLLKGPKEFRDIRGDRRLKTKDGK